MKTPEVLIQQAFEALTELKDNHHDYWKDLNVELRESQGISLAAGTMVVIEANRLIQRDKESQSQ